MGQLQSLPTTLPKASGQSQALFPGHFWSMLTLLPDCKQLRVVIPPPCVEKGECPLAPSTPRAPGLLLPSPLLGGEYQWLVWPERITQADRSLCVFTNTFSAPPQS